MVNYTPYQNRTKEIRVEKNRFIGSIKYPDLSKGSIANSDQYQEFISALNRLVDLANKHPNAKTLVADRLSEMNATKQMILQGNVLVNGTWKSKKDYDAQMAAVLKGSEMGVAAGERGGLRINRESPISYSKEGLTMKRG